MQDAFVGLRAHALVMIVVEVHGFGLWPLNLYFFDFDLLLDFSKHVDFVEVYAAVRQNLVREGLFLLFEGLEGVWQ